MSLGWKEGLLGCCSPISLCCEGCWCPCIVLGRTIHRMNNKGNMQEYYCCNVDCGILCALHALGGCGWIYQSWRRGQIRKEYHIGGTSCSDCVASLCCHCCAIIQQEKEVKARTSSIIETGYQEQP
ncbi:hypothetical protein F5883DRAFT_155121, partial [Diaporthe sp. PMI_573]